MASDGSGLKGAAAPFSEKRIALIGFGEVGGRFAEGFIALGRYEVVAYDILLERPEAAPALREKAARLGVELAPSAAAAADGAQVVISAVTAGAARKVAEAAAGYLRPGQFFLDLNSTSPGAKRAGAEAVGRSGAQYVEAAVMAAVAPYGLKVPMLLGGPAAGALKEMLDPAGMALELAAAEIGTASATKMCRSIMMKGLEALTVECLATARRYGVEDAVLASFAESYPTLDWERLGGYLIGRVLEHGRRRAEEMRESAATIAEAGLEPLMASAIARRQDWLADRTQADPALRRAKDEAWRATLDRIAGQER